MNLELFENNELALIPLGMAASSAMRVLLKLAHMIAARLVLVHRTIVSLESASAS